MELIKNKHINLAIIIATIINAIVGGFLVYTSFQGHSSFGIILGAILPIIALVLYINIYGKYEDLEITKDLEKKIFKPSIKIVITLLVLMVILVTWISISQNEISIDSEYIYFFTIVLLIFLIPNLLVQFGFYLFLKRKY
ncbi:hypothetical protein JBL43_00745 [Aureibaculum sp. A20]|uniref:Uncharacterized protein n=1 Tax=Aureibaculum flavum TaxID=2795986 RepID=A0ABS0WLA6_9FLAO|nr:hypothetical protein [Aureibaculum flavum]MBJ2172743.1 hypothetical protein [Aureibaculum flavum]